MRYFLVLPILLAWSANAVDAKGAFYAFGSTSCGEYINQRTNHMDTMGGAQEFYAAGWITALNNALPDTYNLAAGKDMQSIMLWLDKYCRDNPLSKMQLGLAELTRELYPQRQTNIP